MTISELSTKIVKLIKQSPAVYITGHKNLDLDALGAMVGLYLLSNHYGKKAKLIIDDKVHEDSVKKALSQLNDISIIKTDEIKQIKDNTLLIIADTNRPVLIQNEELLNKFYNIMILDHHDEDENTLSNTNNFIFANVSSTCEIITRILQDKDLIPSRPYANLILSGIILDTNSFSLKTDEKTYEAAYYLTKHGANNNEVQYLLKQDFKKYIARQKMLYDVAIVNKRFAFFVGNKKDIYRRSDLATIADTLLQFDNIEASFVIGFLEKGKVGVSARSMGKLDVSLIMQNFSGGGNSTVAATAIETEDIKQIEKELKQVLKSL